MNVRSWFFGLVDADATLDGLVGDRIYPSNTVFTVPPTPYMVYKVSSLTPRIATALNTQLQVWAHDEPGDYTTIDDILARVKEVLESQGNSGDFLSAEWLDGSEDGFDDATGTIMRYDRYTIVQSR